MSFVLLKKRRETKRFVQIETTMNLVFLLKIFTQEIHEENKVTRRFYF